MKRRFAEFLDDDAEGDDSYGRPRGRTIGFTDVELESRFSQGDDKADENLMDEAAARRMIMREREEAGLMDEATIKRKMAAERLQQRRQASPSPPLPTAAVAPAPPPPDAATVEHAVPQGPPVAVRPVEQPPPPEPPAAPAAPATDAGGGGSGQNLSPGSFVTLTGLLKATELNGQPGRLERWDQSSNRWDVRLRDGDVKAIKPENLLPRAPEPGEASEPVAPWAPRSPDQAAAPSSPRVPDVAPRSPPPAPLGVAGLSSAALAGPPPVISAAAPPKVQKPKNTRRLGTIRWYNGRRKLGQLIPDDSSGSAGGKDLFIPAQGAPNGSMVPPQPGGLFHGTRVSFQPTALKPSSTDPGAGTKEIVCMDVRPLSGQPGLSVGVDTQIGAKEKNDDRIAASDMHELGFFAAVCDGHRGHHCAEFVAKQLPTMLLQCYRARAKREGASAIMKMTHTQEAAMISKALVDAFEKTDEAFLVSARKKDMESGSTAVTALVCHGFEVPLKPDTGNLGGVSHLWPKPDPATSSSASTERNPGTVGRAPGGVAKLFIAWAGDSRAIIVRGRNGIRCTEDHRPSRRDEMNRVKNVGGFVAQDAHGIWRVGRREESKLARELQKRSKIEPARMKWFLSTSRSFGDTELKQPDPIVIATPEVKVIDLVPEDWAVLLGSDGVFDTLSDQKIADILWKAMAVQGKDPVSAAKAVTHAAIAAGSRDNCTSIVMRLGWTAPPLPTDPATAAAGADASARPKQDDFNMFG